MKNCLVVLGMYRSIAPLFALVVRNLLDVAQALAQRNSFTVKKDIDKLSLAFNAYQALGKEARSTVSSMETQRHAKETLTCELL